MESSLKRRVVGALVLIALAVILVPAWLDGSVRHMRDETAFVVPLPPPTRVVTIAPDSIGQPLPRAGGELASAPDGTVKTLRKLDDPEAPVLDGSASESAVAAVEQTGPLASWIVQVGSFASEANAVAMVQRLRDGDLAAFKRDFNSNNETVYRVLVGPFIRQSEADSVKRTIDDQYQLKSFVASWRD
ncbi:MAG: SPOR domain-containing protein [Pseudomonadota bacterium]